MRQIRKGPKIERVGDEYAVVNFYGETVYVTGSRIAAREYLEDNFIILSK